MRMIVLSNGGSAGTAGWHVRDLLRAAVARGHHLQCCPWHRLVGPVTGGGPVARNEQVVLDEADVVMLRTMPPGTLEQIIFRMDLIGRLEAAGVMVVNRPRAIEVAVDKYLALARMAAADLPTPPTIVCQRLADAADAFQELGGDVVVKPLFGSEGFGIMRLTGPELAERVFAALQRMGSVIYLQRFIEARADLRLFVLDDVVVASIERFGSGVSKNVARGGQSRPARPDAALCTLARRAAAACDATIAGVDLVVDQTGRPYVLEVNAVPGWRALTAATGVDIADGIVRWLESR